jgi:hypothetical protein
MNDNNVEVRPKTIPKERHDEKLRIWTLKVVFVDTSSAWCISLARESRLSLLSRSAMLMIMDDKI